MDKIKSYRLIPILTLMLLVTLGYKSLANHKTELSMLNSHSMLAYQENDTVPATGTATAPADTIPPADVQVKQAISKIDSTLEARLKAILDAKDQEERIGTLRMKDSLTIGTKRIGIDSIYISIEEGIITYLKVFMNGGRQFKSKVPINIMNFDERRGDLINEIAGTARIRLDSLVHYDHEPNNRFIPDDFHATLNDAKKKYFISTNKTLNSLVDFRIYTDFLGFINEEENGLVQLEAQAKIFLNTTNIRNKDVIAFKFLQPYLKISRFDQTNNRVLLSVNEDSSALFVAEPNELLQKSTLNIGGNLNLLSYGNLNDHLSFEINSGFGLNVSSTRSPLDSAETDFNSFQFLLEAKLKARRLNNFGLDFSMSGIRLQPLNVREIQSYDSYFILKTSAEMFYFLNERENSVFVRFNYMDNLRRSTGNFYQVQIGYQTPINFRARR